MKNKSKKIMVILGITILLIALGITLPIIVKGDNNDAGKAQVLSGKTFTNGSAVAIAGAMENFEGQIPEVTATAADEDYIATIDLDDGYYESVKINAKPIYDRGVAAGATTHDQTYTFAANDTGATKDLGVNHSYRYVNATNVYKKGKADGQTFTTQTKTTKGGNGVTLTYSFPTKIVGISNITVGQGGDAGEYGKVFYYCKITGNNTVKLYGSLATGNGSYSVTCVGY